LVVVQFAASIALIIGSCVIYLQFDFVRNKDFGFDTSDHLVHMNPYVTDKFLKTSKEIRLADRYETVKQAFLDHPDAIEATAYKQDFGLTTWGRQSLIVERHEDQTWRVPIIEVDDDFIDVLRIKVLAGRKFDGERFPTDHAAVHSDSSVAFIINEKAVTYLGWTLDAAPGTADSPIGKAVRWKIRQGDTTGSIIGVVNDFHYVPMTETIGPLVLAFRTKGFFNLTVRVREGGLDDAIAHFEKTWKHFAPNNPFWHTFWENSIDQGYRQERRTQGLAHVVAGIAIFLACIGLFGLASHAAEVRRKEISVRKVLGASVSSIIVLVSREFVLLVLLSAAIAVPLAYPFAREWLDGFAYRTDLGPQAFLVGIVLTLVISQATVTYHALRAARTDPAVVLRKE
jgi:putative ABC transport system permease protein